MDNIFRGKALSASYVALQRQGVKDSTFYALQVSFENSNGHICSYLKMYEPDDLDLLTNEIIPSIQIVSEYEFHARHAVVSTIP